MNCGRTNATTNETAPAPTIARGTANAAPAWPITATTTKGVPGCFFSKEAEATYDRSIEALARDHGIIK